MDVQLCLRAREFASTLDISIDSSVGLILTLPAISMLGLIRANCFGVASRRPQGRRCLRIFALLAPLEVNFARGDLCCHVPFSNFTHSLSTIKAATHGGHVVAGDLITFCVCQLLLVLIVKGLRANVITVDFHCVSILIFIVVEGAASLLVLLGATYHHA